VNKKKQKNFVSFWAVAFLTPREAEQKFFGSFFQKRTSCFCSCVVLEELDCHAAQGRGSQ
jgi:hypothetical protein